MKKSPFAPLALAGPLLLATTALAAPVPDGSATIRNGSGVNPEVYVPLNTPCIGQTYRAELDLTGIGWGLVFCFAFPGPDSGTFLPNYGEILVDITSGDSVLLDIQNSAEGYTLIEFDVPDDPSIIGLAMSSQSLFNRTSMQPQLTNAVDLVVGS